MSVINDVSIWFKYASGPCSSNSCCISIFNANLDAGLGLYSFEDDVICIAI